MSAFTGPALALTMLAAAFQQTQDTADESASPLEKGRRLYYAGDYAAALSQWEPLADAGNARALYNMATLYREGQGVAPDPARARELLRASAEAGFSEAQYLLASFLFDEAGDDESGRQQAVRLWLAAADQGHDSARYRLGLLYWNGEAVARDLVRGHAWMALAAAGGLDMAQSALDIMTEHLTEPELRESSDLQAYLKTPRADRRDEPTISAPAATAAQQAPARQDQARQAASRQATAAQDSATETSSPSRPQAAADSRPTADPSPAVTEGWRLQIAAFRSPEDAEAEWSRLNTRAPDLVADLRHRVMRADLGDRGVFYRLRIGPFASRDDAVSRCQALKAAGFGCFPQAPGS